MEENFASAQRGRLSNTGVGEASGLASRHLRTAEPLGRQRSGDSGSLPPPRPGGRVTRLQAPGRSPRPKHHLTPPALSGRRVSGVRSFLPSDPRRPAGDSGTPARHLGSAWERPDLQPFPGVGARRGYRPPSPGREPSLEARGPGGATPRAPRPSAAGGRASRFQALSLSSLEQLGFSG